MNKLARAFAAVLLAALASSIDAHASCQLGTLAVLPVNMEQRRPTVSTRINGMKAELVLGTASSFSTMSPANAAKYGLKLSAAPSGLIIEGPTGEATFAIGKPDTFVMSGLSLGRVEFLVTGSEVSVATGILGDDFFRLGDAEFDFANGMARLIQPKGCAGKNLAYWAKPGQAFGLLPIEPVVPGRAYIRGNILINGVRLRATFDTGAVFSTLTRRAAARLGISLDTPGVLVSGYTSSIGPKLAKSWFAPITSVKIGDEEVRNTHLRVADLTAEESDIIVGVDFFLSHHVYVATSQSKLYFTYNGGALFDNAPSGAAATNSAAGDHAPAGSVETLDAPAYSRRGVAHLARREFELAIADLTRAITLAPKEADYLYERAEAQSAAGRPLLARVDLDAALALAPDDARAHVFRAALELREADKSSAVADYDAAARVGAPQDDVRLTIASGYVAGERPEAAIPQFDLWIASHGADSRMPVARNGRCWARALAGQDLARALDDCNTAMRTTTQAANTLDSRGLVYLRLGKFDKAIADYDAALRLNPKIAWSLYGRGVAELRMGQDARAAADFAASAALAPGLAELAQAYGIAPKPN